MKHIFEALVSGSLSAPDAPRFFLRSLTPIAPARAHAPHTPSHTRSIASALLSTPGILSTPAMRYGLHTTKGLFASCLVDACSNSTNNSPNFFCVSLKKTPRMVPAVKGYTLWGYLGDTRAHTRVWPKQKKHTLGVPRPRHTPECDQNNHFECSGTP